MVEIDTNEIVLHKIYAVINNQNGKMYIGRTSDTVETRWKQHILASKTSPCYFNRAIRKHGSESFTVKEIDRTFDKNESYELEKLYIGIFRTHKSEYGYNGSLGGDGGGIPNEETRKKLRAKRAGRKPSLGMRHTDEWKQQHSQDMTGEKHP